MELSKEFIDYCKGCPCHRTDEMAGFDIVHCCTAMNPKKSIIIWGVFEGDKEWAVVKGEADCPFYLEYLLWKDSVE